MTLRRPHNILVSLLVLIISLIINPVLAMPGHHTSTTPSAPSTPPSHAHHQHQSHDDMLGSEQSTHNADHRVGQSTEIHCDNCVDTAAMDLSHCGSDGDGIHCKSCNSNHCQYSALPVFHLAQSLVPSQVSPQRLLVSDPVSRQEPSLRPPIH